MRKRVKKIVIWSGIVLGIVALGALLVNAYLVWTTGTQLEKRLAALREAGEPVALKDLAQPPIPPETNAAVFLDRARADMRAIEKELQGFYQNEGYENVRLDAAEQKKLQGLFEAYPKVIPLLEQAAACPDYDSELDYTVNPNQFIESTLEYSRRNRAPARILRVWATLEAAQDRRDEALRSVLTLYRLTRHFDRDPMFVNYLLAVACRGVANDLGNRILQAGPVSKDVREALEAELARHDKMEGYGWALRSERACGLSCYATFPGANNWVMAAHWNRSRLAYLAMIEQELALADQTYAEWRRRSGRTAPPRDTMVALVWPAVQATRSATERTRAEIRALRVLNAIQARVPPGSKDVPRLTELGLPPEATTDPFNGEPLRIKRLPEGWLIYSVGSNLQDDGGEKLDGLSDAGIGPIRRPPAPNTK